MPPMNLPPLPFTARSVRRISRVSREEFVTAQLEEPFVVTGSLESWPLFQRMRECGGDERKLALLGSLVGQTPVSYHRLPQQLRGHFHFQEGNPEQVTFGKATRREEVSFDVLARELLECQRGESADSVYMQAHFIEKGTPLFGALGPGVLPFLPEDNDIAMMWVGSNGQVVNLHYDDFTTVICMVNGMKRVTLFPPESLPHLYQAPFDRMLEYCQTSLVRVLEPDLRRYPLFERAQREAQVAVLEPGDVLVMPPMWWHHVESFGLNVMVNTRLFPASFPQLESAYSNLSRAVKLFFPRSQEQRNRALALYREAVFAPGASEPGPVHSAAVAEETPELARHRAETREVAASIPAFLREHLARYYEHFVFQASGDPHPTLPGAFAAMVERNRHSPTLFPRE
ncbi:hypothetical protein Q664_14085 [Archangium violaceum Cb vi76]|uniref:JmjC domain-containing protein n=2 Tax=Archangium violaceum TaxID=83451 RepID=A0A084SW86_9BACT|nr:hypothetical protein Q664_14085 [Archangium violaceum Cb vi76]